MRSQKQPYVFCQTCRQPMPFPDVPFEEMLVHTPQEVAAACREDGEFTKVLKCRNPDCVAPRRAIIMIPDEEPELVAAVRSWLPVSTFRLRWSHAKSSPDGRYAVAEFAIDKIERTADISFSPSVDIKLLRRTLDGFGREIEGPLTVFDFFCWGSDLSDPNNWLLHPIEAFDEEDRAAPPRFNPICALVRKYLHRAAWRKLRERLKQGACPFLAQPSQASQLPISREPSCVDCEAASALARDEPEKVVLRNCYLYTQILSEVSPCYKSDRDQFVRFLEFCGTIARNRDIREAAEEWKESLAQRVCNCWAGFAEITCPIIVHDHLVAIAMTGQLVQVPDGAALKAHQQRLHDIRDHAVPLAVKSLELSPTDEEELRKAFELEEWSRRQEEEGCCWLVTKEQTDGKMATLKESVQMIEGVAQDRYTKERRLREQYFQDELYGRFEMAREKSREITMGFLPGILTRMSEFWAFHDAAYLGASPRTAGKLAVLSDGTEVFDEEDLEKRVAPVEFQRKAPRLGAVLIVREGGVFDVKPHCDWVPTIKEVRKVLGRDKIDDLVAYVTPTAFGQDLFVFHRRDLDRVSYKPRPADPSLELLVSIRQVCSGLSKRFADWMHFGEQVRNLHVLGHTIRTPIETVRIALDNLLAEEGPEQERSARNLKSAIQDAGETVALALDVVRTIYEDMKPAKVEVDLLDEIRRIARQYAARYGRQWTFDAGGETHWYMYMAPKRLRLVLANAITNAFKYSAYKHRPVKIVVTEHRDSKHLSWSETVLQIENRGWGLLDSEKPFVGTLLFRGVAVQNKPGSGLGLFLIASIMRQERREWQFTSEPVSRWSDPRKDDDFVNTLLLRLPGRIHK